MGILRGSVFCAISALLLATSAPAQEGELEVPGAVLYAGTKVTIGYSGNFEQGYVVVEVYDPINGESQDIHIPVNEGEGSTTWDVPEDWDVAYFNAPNAPLVARMIAPDPLD